MARDRLQKVLAAAGVASRRGSEALIAAGRVTVGGKVAQLGDSADPEADAILVDGRPVGPASRPVHLVLNKPAGVTSTVRDRHAERTVVELVPTALVPPGGRLYPAGRLDRDSEGLILLTNDGPWADKVTHPRHGVDREYALALARPLTGAQVAALEQGIELDEGVATFVRLRPRPKALVAALAAVLDPPPDPALAWYDVILRQGWRRQVRRMLAAVGAPVERLVRVRIGHVRLERLEPGRVRALTEGEIRVLAGEAPPRPKRPRRLPAAARPGSGPRSGRRTARPRD